MTEESELKETIEKVLRRAKMSPSLYNLSSSCPHRPTNTETSHVTCISCIASRILDEVKERTAFLDKNQDTPNFHQLLGENTFLVKIAELALAKAKLDGWKKTTSTKYSPHIVINNEQATKGLHGMKKADYYKLLVEIEKEAYKDS